MGFHCSAFVIILHLIVECIHNICYIHFHKFCFVFCYFHYKFFCTHEHSQFHITICKETLTSVNLSNDILFHRAYNISLIHMSNVQSIFQDILSLYLSYSVKFTYYYYYTFTVRIVHNRTFRKCSHCLWKLMETVPFVKVRFLLDEYLFGLKRILYDEEENR